MKVPDYIAIGVLVVLLVWAAAANFRATSCSLASVAGAAMMTAERILIGVASLVALIGWLRWVGVAGSHDGEVRSQHPTGPPNYRRPSKAQNSKPLPIKPAVHQG